MLTIFLAHESHESTRSVFNGLIMATCSVARIFTNSMRGMLFYDDNSNFTNLTNSLIIIRVIRATEQVAINIQDKEIRVDS